MKIGPHPNLPQGEGVDGKAKHFTPLPCGGVRREGPLIKKVWNI